MKILSKRESEHTVYSYLLGILSFITLVYIGFNHINDVSSTGEYFGRTSMIEGFLALGGVLSLDIINNGVLKGEFRPITLETVVLGIAGFFGMVIIQIISQVPMTIRDAEMAAAIIFAAPAEELFFRGALLSLTQKISLMFKNQLIIKSGEVKLGAIDIMGILVSSLLFSAFHVNYYGDIRVMLVTFSTGIFLGVLYLWKKDITANIIAHLILNIIVVGQMFWLVNL